jgi:hypothetical protein
MAIVRPGRVPVPSMARRCRHRRRTGRPMEGRCRERIIAIWGCVAMLAIVDIVPLLLARQAKRPEHGERKACIETKLVNRLAER